MKKNDSIKKAKFAALGIMVLGAALLYYQASMALYAFGAGLMLSGAGAALSAGAMTLDDKPINTSTKQPVPKELNQSFDSEKFDPQRTKKVKIILGLGMALLGMGLFAHLSALLLVVFS